MTVRSVVSFTQEHALVNDKHHAYTRAGSEDAGVMALPSIVHETLALGAANARNPTRSVGKALAHLVRPPADACAQLARVDFKAARHNSFCRSTAVPHIHLTVEQLQRGRPLPQEHAARPGERDLRRSLNELLARDHRQLQKLRTLRTPSHQGQPERNEEHGNDDRSGS
jgi:hypothetical protein